MCTPETFMCVTKSQTYQILFWRWRSRQPPRSARESGLYTSGSESRYPQPLGSLGSMGCRRVTRGGTAAPHGPFSGWGLCDEGATDRSEQVILVFWMGWHHSWIARGAAPNHESVFGRWLWPPPTSRECEVALDDDGGGATLLRLCGKPTAWPGLAGPYESTWSAWQSSGDRWIALAFVCDACQGELLFSVR